jgi:hypothetical protein
MELVVFVWLVRIVVLTSPIWVAFVFMIYALQNRYSLRALLVFVTCECVAIAMSVWFWNAPRLEGID